LYSYYLLLCSLESPLIISIMLYTLCMRVFSVWTKIMMPFNSCTIQISRNPGYKNVLALLHGIYKVFSKHEIRFPWFIFSCMASTIHVAIYTTSCFISWDYTDPSFVTPIYLASWQVLLLITVVVFIALNDRPTCSSFRKL